MGEFSKKLPNNSTSTVGKVHKLLYDTEHVPFQIIDFNHGIFADWLSHPRPSLPVLYKFPYYRSFL